MKKEWKVVATKGVKQGTVLGMKDLKQRDDNEMKGIKKKGKVLGMKGVKQRRILGIRRK